MKIKLLDTVTRNIVETTEPADSFQWAENNWSCDCNRQSYFEPIDWEASCVSVRYLVIGVSEPTRDYYTLKDYNDGYPDELLAKYNISDESPLDGSGVKL